MKINIIQHNQHDSMCDAETIMMILRRLKKKPEIKNVPINNSPNNVENAHMNIFIDGINMSFVPKASTNIIIVNHFTFTPVWKELLVNFDLILCKTKYAYDIFSEFVEKDKLMLVPWQSSERGTGSIEKERDQIMLMYTNPFAINLQPILDAWELEYPELNIVMVTDIPKNITRRNLPNINYIQNLSTEKFNILFNKCLIHICLANMDNFNHNANQCQMSHSIPIIVNKGSSLEVVDPDGYFGVSSNKKKNLNFLGSRYAYNKDSVKETLEKVFATSDTTLEIMSKTAANYSLRNKMKSTEKLVPIFQNLVNNSSKIKTEDVKKEDLPKLSIVTHVRNMKKMFKLAIINYRTTKYENMEWVIIDTSDEDQRVKEALPPEDMWQQFGIKYLTEESDKSLGYLYNKAIEQTTNNTVMIMQPDDFYYENGIVNLVKKLIQSKKQCVGMSGYGCFHISRYISMINVVPIYMPYYGRIYHGSLCFNKKFWESGKFSEEGTLLKPFLEGRTAEFQEIYYENIMIGLIHNLNPRGGIPDNQESNGCHFKLSEKVFKFVCSLETEEERNTENSKEPSTDTNEENVDEIETNKEIKEI